MSTDQSAHPRPAALDDPASASRHLMRLALKGALATLDRHLGHPYASLVLLATDPTGAPLFLISRLAQHTRNLEQDPRASLLLDGTDGLADPLTGGRLTLTGTAAPCPDPAALRRFLARHPSAQGYAQFADFRLYALTVTQGHYVGGFGRIVDLSAPSLLTGTADAGDLLAAEPEILAHMNADHADAIDLCAAELAGRAAGAWRMVGVDPAGIDLLQCTMAARIDFPEPIRTPGQARAQLVSLVQQARARRQARA
jgi:heme oxygenase (biliverdin-IX-beta and delta-forming)